MTHTRSQANVVQRAVDAGSVTSGSHRGARHFLALVVMVIVAGSTAVGFAWAERQYEYPTLFDSWENAYAVFDCRVADSWLPPFESRENPNGIRSRGDGVIYIEPNDQSATGDNAQLGLFLGNVGATLTDDTLILPDGTTISEDDAWCNGEEAILQVARWDAPPLGWATPLGDRIASEVVTEGLAATRFLGDQQALVIALAPIGSTFPPPETVAGLSGQSEGQAS